MIDPRLYIAAGALAAAFGAGWLGNGWRLGGTISDLKAEHSQTVATAARTALNAQRALDDQRDKLATRLSEIDGVETAALRTENDEIERLRKCVADGTCGLRLAATCPSDVPRAPSGSGVDTGTEPGLTPDAGQAYFALRTGIATAKAQLSACQETLKAERVTTP